MVDIGLADIGLPDANDGHAVLRNALGRNQTHEWRRADGSAQVAAVARPVHKRLIDGDLAEQIVHIVIGACARLRITPLLVEDEWYCPCRQSVCHRVRATQSAQKRWRREQAGLPGRLQTNP